MDYYYVRHKNLYRSEGASVVQAETPDDAAKLFFDPEAVGKTAEVREVRKAKRIPKYWNVMVENNEGFLVTYKTRREIPLNNPYLRVPLIVRDEKRIEVYVKDIVSASKPNKDKNVMKHFLK